MHQESTKRLALAVTVVPVCLLTYFLHVEEKPFFATSIAGTFLIHMWTRPPRRELVLTLGIASALLAAFALGRLDTVRGAAALFLTTGACLGLGSLAVTGAQAIWRQGAERQARLDLFLPLFLMMLSSIIGALALLSTIYFHPRTFDLALYQFDSTLGFQASFWMGRLFEAAPAVAWVSRAVYAGVLIAISVLYAFEITSPARSPVNILYVFFAAGFTGLMLYFFVPATGPVFVFGPSFPHHPPADTHGLILSAPAGMPRNAMPSVHTAWGLLVWWNSRGRALWVRMLAALFLTFTVLATLGLGEHYLIDLVVAVPFTVALQAAFTWTIPLRRPERSRALLTGAALTIAWMTVLRASVSIFERTPALSWAAVIPTLVVPVWLERKLAVAARQPQVAPPLTREKKWPAKRDSI